MITLNPVAYFISDAKERADVPRQGALALSNRGIIRFISGMNFEQALEDLQGMERIWVLFWMDRVAHWKCKVQPPRATSKKGVFATRSPHRPNPIGLSCVQLISVSGLDLTVEGHDLMDGSPILDIKPYIAYADSFPKAASGWIEKEGDLKRNRVDFSLLAEEELFFIEKEEKENLKSKIESRLEFFLKPSSSNRVKKIEEDFYCLSYKSWRYLFRKELNQDNVTVLAVFSGYDNRSQEVPSDLHDKFQYQFGKKNIEAFSLTSFFTKLASVISSIE